MPSGSIGLPHYTTMEADHLKNSSHLVFYGIIRKVDPGTLHFLVKIFEVVSKRASVTKSIREAYSSEREDEGTQRLSNHFMYILLLTYV
jgi:hypothetical protein